LVDTLDIESLIRPEAEAVGIANNWREWSSARRPKIDEWRELRNYLFATDTKTTSNRKLPWSNSTTTPKLTQIRDNLHANYFAALFPQVKWFRWQADDQDSSSRTKRSIIQNYVQTKVDQSGFIDTVSRLVLDWIDTGNVFAMVEHVADYVQHGDGDLITTYIGPKLRRISPYDIVFNPLAEDFAKTPKIIKELVTVGDLKKRIAQDPSNAWMEGAFTEMEAVRGHVSEMDSEFDKSDGFIADGFSSLTHYYESGYVELLHFFGDIYNRLTGELQLNRIITVADRSRVLRNIPNPSWLGSGVIRHTSWRQRPDNLYGMGPLENLVGLQYRIDHLENLKADVFDQIAYPTKKIRGDVQEFGEGLGERIYLGEEGDVTYLVPDSTALNADFQIQDLSNKMEELAGAPRNAMGIRTPGEKTAFEVQTLNTGASRIFSHKAGHFERTFVELLLNDMLEVGRRNLNESEVIRGIDQATGVELFRTITREDITARGKLRPMGARHFAERALRLQNLQTLIQIKATDPTVGVHLSGKLIAQLLAQELDEENLFGENISLFEQMQAQQIAEELQINEEERQQVAAEEGL